MSHEFTSATVVFVLELVTALLAFLSSIFWSVALIFLFTS